MRIQKLELAITLLKHYFTGRSCRHNAVEKGKCSWWWVFESCKRTVKYNKWDWVRWTTSTLCISAQKGKIWRWQLTTTTGWRGAYSQAYRHDAGLYYPIKTYFSCIRKTSPSFTQIFFKNLELIDYLILCTVIRYKVLLGDNFIFLKHSKNECFYTRL